MNLAAVLSGRAGADGVRRFLEGAPAREAWARLEALLEPGAAVRDFRIHRVKLKPGRKLSAWCVALVRDPRGHLCSRHVAVTWSPAGSPLPPGTEAIEDDARGRGLAAPFRSLAAAVPGTGMRILAAPLDPRLPALVRMSDPAFAGEAVGPGAVTTIRYRPGERHVLRYGGPAQVRYAKLYRPGAAEDAWLRAAAVCAAVSCGPAAVRAARPRLWRSEEALVTPAVGGRPAGVAEIDLEAAGSLLRVIHGGVAPPGPPSTLAGEIEAVERAAQHIEALLPPAGAALRRTLATAREWGERAGEGRSALIHGDFKLDHLLWNRGTVTVIDLDRARPGEPALDMGKMLADLRWRRAGAAAIGDGPAARLLHGYGPGGTDAGARAGLYEAIFLIKAAARRASLLDPGWEQVVGAAVREAADLVEGAQGRPRARAAGGVPA
jgi:aminoglycoside phosphotransferase (APT) family kinase protein